MAYCTVDNVQSEFKSLTFGSATKITSSEVSGFIVQSDNQINAQLAQIISTPVVSATSPNFFSICQRMSTYNVVERCKRILFKKVGTDKVDDQVEVSLEKVVKDELEDIVSKRKTLDAVRITSNQYGISDHNYTNSITPVFDKDNDQW